MSVKFLHLTVTVMGPRNPVFCMHNIHFWADINSTPPQFEDEHGYFQDAAQ